MLPSRDNLSVARLGVAFRGDCQDGQPTFYQTFYPDGIIRGVVVHHWVWLNQAGRARGSLYRQGCGPGGRGFECPPPPIARKAP